jgi:hypothetical protein
MADVISLWTMPPPLTARKMRGKKAAEQVIEDVVVGGTGWQLPSLAVTLAAR